MNEMMEIKKNYLFDLIRQLPDFIKNGIMVFYVYGLEKGEEKRVTKGIDF